MSHIAFIGLGSMGASMALNLCKAGHRLDVFDPVADAMQALVKAGATAAGSAAEAVAQADVVISVLSASRHMENLYLGPRGILPLLRPGTLIIECSATTSAAACALDIAAAQAGLSIIDGEVSGGTIGAAAGTLTFIVGGAGASLERARPILRAMGKNIVHAGPAGASREPRAASDELFGGLMSGAAGAMALCVASGASRQMTTGSSGAFDFGSIVKLLKGTQ